MGCFEALVGGQAISAMVEGPDPSGSWVEDVLQTPSHASTGGELLLGDSYLWFMEQRVIFRIIKERLFNDFSSTRAF